MLWLIRLYRNERTNVCLWHEADIADLATECLLLEVKRTGARCIKLYLKA